MPPLNLEILAQDEKWKILATLSPEDTPGSISDNSDGIRNVYVFECSNERSRVYLSKGGLDFCKEENRVLVTEDLPILKELKKDEPPYEFKVRPDGSSTDV